jgi:hypothetical protein
MNRYGSLARDHWERNLPTRMSSLSDCERFFTDLGEQIMEQVLTLWERLQSQDRPRLNQLPDLERIGAINALRKSAEEIVFDQMIWPEGSRQEPQLEDLETISPSSPQPHESTMQWVERLGVWLTIDEPGPASLMPLDRTHPLWALREDYLQDDATAATETTWDQQYRTWLRSLPEEVLSTV